MIQFRPIFPLVLFAAACAVPAPNGQVIEAVFRCDDGSSFAIRFDNRIGAAFLALPEGDEARLEQQRVASGFWYRNAEYDLRGKGREAIFTMEGAPRLHCRSD